VLLVVDDEPSIRSALQRCLRREGYEILLAPTAAAALELLRARPVDALLSDYKMPGRNGLELCREVAARWPSVARFLLTGFAPEIDGAEVRRLGIRALVPKPWDDAELKRLLREAL
jgi:CheY-like chemotaxis protein